MLVKQTSGASCDNKFRAFWRGLYQYNDLNYGRVAHN